MEKCALVVGAWNVRKLLDRFGIDRPEKRTVLEGKELSRYNVDLTALSATRLADQGQLTETSCGYTFCWIGRPAHQLRTAGVGYAISNSVPPKLENLQKGINERLMTLRIKRKGNHHLTLVSVWAPTLMSDDIKEQFYEYRTCIRSSDILQQMTSFRSLEI